MSTWKTITERRLLGLMKETSAQLSKQEFHFFESIRISPQKWDLEPWTNKTEGFWVIGIIGKTVLWYNDFEDGFNYSTYSKLGDIGEYWCDQDEFDLAIRQLHAFIQTGEMHSKCGPPNPIS